MRHYFLLIQLLATLLIHASAINAKEMAENLKPTANQAGLWGVKDSAGKEIVPFKYSYAERMGDEFFQVGLPSKGNQSSPNRYGIINKQGQMILPVQYDGIDYLADKKRFKVVVTDASGQDKFGVLDTQGKIVVPVIYDYMERISNMGDEPTSTIKLKDKVGYINMVTGEVLIKPIYDRLDVTSLNTDVSGVGLATAAKQGKWGVLATNGQVVVPFEYDTIAELSTSDGHAFATKHDQFVQLNFKNNQFVGASDIAAQYSSNFAPRLSLKINIQPFDGVYVAQDYPNMKAAFDGWQAQKLRWIAMPSIQVNGDEVYVAFGIFNDISLPLLPNVMAIARQKNGFVLLNDFNTKAGTKSKPEEWLSFTASNEGLKCKQCAHLGLPVIWKLIKQEPEKTFSGIGIAISKMYASSELVSVNDVLVDGPAYKVGLRAKDYIVAINGQSIENDTIDLVRDKLRGVVGSTVKIKYIRGGSAHEISITRAQINSTNPAKAP
ncbi:MAG: WG repeat-containing protein [Methylophilaceae bacterium]